MVAAVAVIQRISGIIVPTLSISIIRSKIGRRGVLARVDDLSVDIYIEQYRRCPSVRSGAHP
jgi:hypothetical protein